MKYRDIIKALFKAENEDYIPDGLAYSEAMCEQRNTVTLDSFFLYSITETRDKGVGPLAKVILDLQSERVVEYFEYENYSEFSLLNNNDEESVINALDEYELLYPAFRDCCFNEHLNDADREIVRRIWRVISIFENEDMLKIYKTMAPEMFGFIEKNGLH